MTDIVTPPASILPPVFPALGDPEFNAKSYAWGTSFPAVSVRFGEIAEATWHNAIAAQERAIAADGSAQAAAVSAADAQTHAQDAGEQAALAAQAAMASATLWVPGGSYTVNTLVWLDMTTGLLFRALQTHTGRAAPPDADTESEYWAPVGVSLSSRLTGLSLSDSGAIEASDTALQAFGKLQAGKASLSALDALLDVPTSTVTSGPYTLQLVDRGNCIDVGHTITVPTLATVAFPKGSVVNLQNVTAGGLTISAESGATVRRAGSASDIGPFTLAAYGWAVLRKIDGASTWVISGAGL